MLLATMSNSTSLSEEAASTVSSGFGSFNPVLSAISPQQQQQQQQEQKIKKKRNLPGNPDPDAEVIALSPKTLMATNRFVCEVCNKGFQRDQNLQLHRRGHNLPWKLKQRNNKEIRKRAYVCPEPTCVHHHPSRALGDLTGIKKHFCRKHGEKKWKCEKCAKIYAVQSDWKAHSKTCGTREYRCDCGTLFSRKDSFITHRAFCDALAEESARLSANPTNPTLIQPLHPHPQSQTQSSPIFPFSTQQQQQQNFPMNPPTHISLTSWHPTQIKTEMTHPISSSAQFFPGPAPHKTMLRSPYQYQNPYVTTQPTSTCGSSAHLSATALLQKAATIGATGMTGAQAVGHHHQHMSTNQMGELGRAVTSHMGNGGTGMVSPEYLGSFASWQKRDRLTRDFLGLAGGDQDGGSGGGGGGVRDLLPFTGGFPLPTSYERDHSLLKTHQGFGFAEAASETWGDC